MKGFARRSIIFVGLVLLAGCSTVSQRTSGDDIEQGSPDLSCAYFYFLWGTHAEYNLHFAEALEAYEKALICDPSATYVQKKLPILLIKLGKTDQAAQFLQQAIQQDPQDTSQFLLLAHLRIQQNRRQEAILLYHQVLELEPDNEGVLLRLGILYSQENQLDQAEKIFRDLLRKDSELHFAHIYLARLLHQQQSLAEAAKEYEHALRLNWSPELVYEMIDFYQDQDKQEEVLRLYTTITENDADNERGALGRIQTLLRLDKNQEAIDELRQLRNHSRNPAEIDLAIGKILLRLGHIDEAVELLHTLQQGETGSEASYLLGLVAFQAEEFSKALSYLAAISPDSVEYTEAVYLQVMIFRDMGEIDKALALLRGSLSDPANRHPLFYALLSSLYQDLDNDEEAMRILIEGTTVFPDDEQLHFEYALLLEQTGRPLDAVHSMEKVLELHPDHPEALNFIGYTLADQNMQLEQAYAYIRQAIELKPDSGYIRDSMGWVYYRLGDLKKAQQELLKALDLEPDDPHIYDHLGDVYRSLNKTNEALLAYQKALEMFDDELKKAVIQKKIDELTNQ